MAVSWLIFGLWTFLLVFGWIISVVFIGLYVKLRSEGQLGGGRKVWDIRAAPDGRVTQLRLYRKGSYYKQYASPGKAVITEIVGMFNKKRDIMIDEEQLIPIDDKHYLLDQPGRKNLNKILGLQSIEYSKREASLMNHISWLTNELRHMQAHPIRDNILDQSVKLMDKMSKALPSFGAPKKSTTK